VSISQPQGGSAGGVGGSASGSAGAGGAGGDGGGGPPDAAALCGLPVTGSCLEPNYSCIDFTGAGRPGRMPVRVQPVAAAMHPGCRFGTPGAAGCYVTWRTTGGNYFVECGLQGGEIVWF